MPTEPRRRARALVLAALLALALAPATARAQIEVGPETEVHSIRFQYIGGHMIPSSSLRVHNTIKAPGAFAWLRGLLSWIPLVPHPPREGLDPVALQRDVARMRRFYQESGFPEASIRYRVRKDARRDRVDITYFVREGPPLLVHAVEFRAANDSSGALQVAPGDSAAWERFRAAREPRDSVRLITAQMVRLQGDVQDFWLSRGHPFVVTTVTIDTSGPRHALIVRAAPGPRAVIGAVQVTGDSVLPQRVVRRALGLHEGQLASSRLLDRSERQVRSLEAVRGAVVDVPQDQPHDSVVTVQARISEADRHVVSGQAGYVNDAGLAAEVSWTHRNFLGGARTLTVTGDAQTGYLTPVQRPQVVERVTVSLRQPAVFNPRWTLLAAPFAEYRDDYSGRSRKLGADLSLIDQLGPFENVTVKYGLSTQRVFEYQLGNFAAGRLDLLTALAEHSTAFRDSIGASILTSAFTVSATLGRLDDPLYPRRGFAFRPSVQIATPSGFNAKEYGRVEGRVNGYVTTGMLTLAMRVTAGRLFPYGNALPRGSQDPYFKFLRLRDVLFLGGGAADVRGWQDQLLGPKFPDVRNGAKGLFALGYLPVGGFNHSSASVELQLPVPGFSSYLGWHAFLDGGRVWTTDARYLRGTIVPGQERFFYGTGAGIDVRTPAGPIRFSVGYKLNPSAVDLIHAGDYLRAVLNDLRVEDQPRHANYRFSYHFSVGAQF